MITFITTTWIGLEALCYFFFFESFLHRGNSFRRIVLAFLLTWALFFMCMKIPPLPGIDQLGPICIAIAVSFLLYKGKWYYHILAGFVCYVLFTIIDAGVAYGVSALRNISFTELVQQKYAYLTTVTLAKLVELMLSWLILRLRRRARTQTAGKWILLTLLFPAVSAAMLIVIFFSFQERTDLSLSVLVFSFLLGIANAAILYIIHVIERTTYQQGEMTSLKQTVALQASHFEHLEQNYRSQQRSVHEFERHIQALSDLIESGESDAASKYLWSLKSNHSMRLFRVNTKHPVMDVILDQKYSYALEQNIRMHIQVNDLSSVNLPTEFLVVILSNLLDNAIEACLRLSDNRQIVCSFLAEDNLYFTIRNTSIPVQIEHGRIQTTKEQAHIHGYGLPAVRYALDRLGAEYSMEYRDGWFQFVAEIPIVSPQ